MGAPGRALWGLAALVAGSAGAVWYGLQSGGEAVAQTLPAGANPGQAIRVKTFHPKSGPGLEISVEQPAEVAPYYRVELNALVAGTVKFLEKEMGDKVVAGEQLAEIEPYEAVPERKERTIVSAPFDGLIAQRTVDPGTFVPNPAIVPGVRPLLVLERTDIVTVSMKVPEAFVTHVGKDTEAELRMDAVPGKVFRCRLSRTAPSLDMSDRTLLVEVDLFNGTAEEYRAFLARARLNGQADLKSRTLPVFPTGMVAGGAAGLLPGMYGHMRLRVKQSTNSQLVPSSAIVRQGGLPWLFMVAGGRAKRQRIFIEMDDGVMARVYWLTKEGDQEVRKELTAREELVMSNQGELEDGSPVKPALVEW